MALDQPRGALRGAARAYHGAVTSPTEPAPPREPEIEALARIARTALWLVRRVFWVAGAVAVGHGVWRSGVDGGWSFVAPYALATLPAATGIVWLCLGLPLLVRTGWLFGRGRWPALGLGAALWFGACLLPMDHTYGFVLRLFASLVACLSLLVWRTLWRLTAAAALA